MRLLTQLLTHSASMWTVSVSLNNNAGLGLCAVVAKPVCHSLQEANIKGTASGNMLLEGTIRPETVVSMTKHRASSLSAGTAHSPLLGASTGSLPPLGATGGFASTGAVHARALRWARVVGTCCCNIVRSMCQ